MKRIYGLLLMWGFTFSLSHAQTTFRQSYDIASFDIAGGMVESPAGDFVFAGTNATFIPLYGNVTKVSPNGTVIWSKAYAGGIATDLWDIKNVSTGGYIMTGSSSGSGAILVRIDNNGVVQWAKRYQLPDRPGDDPSNEYGNAVIETSDGGFLVGGGVDYFWDGVSANTVDTASAFGFKVDVNGNLQWSRVWTISVPNPDEHYINDVAETSDGYFFVGESSEGTGTLNSNGDYPRQALVIKTNLAGTTQFVRVFGATGSSQGINAAISLPSSNILVGGYDDVHAFLAEFVGPGATPTNGTFHRRINGSTSIFSPDFHIIQDIMRTSDGNYATIGWEISGLFATFYSTIFKLNSSTGALMFGKGYSPIGLSSILPEGGLAADQGYFMVMTDQQVGGFNYNMIRTDANGDLGSTAGCTNTARTPGTQNYTITFLTPTSANFNLATASAFTPVVSNLTPTKTQHCLNVVCTPPANPTVTATPSTICAGQSSTIGASGSGAGVTYNVYTVPSGGSPIGTAPMSVTPGTTTTYYVEAEDNSNPGCVSARVSVTVTVNSLSTAPASASAAPASVCPGGSTTLSVSGGSLGTGAVWQWYSGSCGGTPVGTGTSISVSPVSTTTYFVQAVGTCNTTSCVSTTVTVNTNSTAPSSASAAPATICNGNSTTLSVTGGSLGTGANWQWFSGSCGGTPVGTGASISVSPSANTTYFVQAVGTCNTTSCVSTSVTVNSNSTAPASANAAPATICNGSSTTLSVTGGSLGTGANWQWFSGSCGGTPVGSGSSITVSPTSTTTFFVQAVGTCNTTTCASVTVTVNSVSTNPTSASASASTICSGSSTTLTVSGGTLGAGANWQWFSGSCGGTPVGSGSSITVSPTSTTTYFVQAVGTCNTTTCVNTTVTVQSNSTAPASATASATSVCPGGSSTLTVNGGSLGTGANWQWFSGSCGGTPVGSGSSITVSPASTTTYFVQAVGTCNTTTCQSVTVTVNTLSTDPVSATSSSTNLCSGSSATLTVNGGSLGTGANWQWFSGSCGGTPVGSGTSITVSPGSTTTYFVQAVGTCNTTLCQSVTITLESLSTDPASASASSATICSGSSTSLTVNGGSLGTGANWQWFSGSCGGTPVGSGTSITVSPASTTTYFVQGIGNCNSTACVQVTVTVIPVEDPSWTSPGATCVPAGPIDLNTLITGTTGGTWSGTGVTGNTFDPTGLAGQTISITYTVGSAPCQQTSTQTISVQSTITATWTAPASMCESDGILSLNPLITGTAGGTWSGTGVTGNTFDPAGLSGSVNITYTVGVSPCQDAVTHTIQVNASPLDPVVAATDTTLCAGSSAVITASGSGAGITYNVYDAASGGTLLGTTPLTVSPASTTTYYVEAQNANGCVNLGGLKPVTIVVNANPVANAGTDVSICQGDNATLIATGGGSYSWTTGDTTSMIVVSPVVNTTYGVTVTNAAGCADVDSVVVTIYTGSALLGAVDDSTSIENVQVAVINATGNDTGNPGGVTIISGPSNGSVSVNGTTVTYTPNAGFVGIDSVQYVICDAFCTGVCDTAWITIRVTEEIVITIPSGFSPNGDGVNDNFEILGLEKYPENELVIFNRWGEIIFTAKPYNNDWHGQSNNDKRKLAGDEVVDGTYYYVLKLTPDDKGISGFVELRRK